MPRTQPMERQLVSAAISDRGVPLTPELRDRMEYCFGTSLRDVRLHFSPASHAANQSFSSLAFALDGHICLRRGLDESLGSAFTALLAHEMAHVVQKRLRRSHGTRRHRVGARLEREARWASEQVHRGQPISGLTADPCDDPRCWDIEGHYYTIFAVALVAGLPLRDAARVAFFAQFPDQVKELDAIPSGGYWIGRYGEFTALNTMMGEYWAYEKLSEKLANFSEWIWRSHSSLRADPWARQYWENQMSEVVQLCQHHWEIQTGLHSLTGRDAEQETEFRKQKLYQLQPDTFEFGLAVHAYGDSFAHRIACNPPLMYAAPLGHAPKGHAADMINRRQGEYRRYAYGLLDIFSARWQTPKLTVDRAKAFATAINNICGLTNACNQIELLLNLADDAWHVSPHYLAEEALLQNSGFSIASWIWRPGECVPWIDFQLKSKVFSRSDKSWMQLSLDDDTYVRSGYQCAKVWCEGARLAGMPAFNDQLYLDNVIHEFAMKFFEVPPFFGQIPVDEERRNSRLFAPKLRQYK